MSETVEEAITFTMIRRNSSGMWQSIEFFNSKRIHQKLGYRTPDKIEEMYVNGELEQLSSEVGA